MSRWRRQQRKRARKARERWFEWVRWGYGPAPIFIRDAFKRLADAAAALEPPCL